MRNLISLIFLFLLSAGLNAQTLNGAELIKNVEIKYFNNDMTFDMDMNLYKGTKIMRSYKMSVIKHQDKLWMEFLAPNIEKGRKMLNDGDNLWMYLPRSKKLIRLPYKQSFMGSDASNRDILRISLTEDYALELTEELGNTIIFHFKAKDLSISYNSLKLHVDSASHVILKQELLTLSGKKLKTIEYMDVQDIAGTPFPMRAIITDELKSKSSTELIYSNVVFSTDKQESFFTISSLQN